MTADTSKTTIVEALSAVMADVQEIRKDSLNKAQGFNFRGIDAVMNAVGPVLRKHGVVAIPHASAAAYRDVNVGQKQTAMRECTVMVTYRFYGPAGDFLDSEVPAEALDSGDKATSKAMSVAYRTCLLQALTIPTDQPDPDETTVDRSAPQQPPAPTGEEWFTANGWEGGEQQYREAMNAAKDRVSTLDDAAKENIRAGLNDPNTITFPCSKGQYTIYNGLIDAEIAKTEPPPTEPEEEPF